MKHQRHSTVNNNSLTWWTRSPRHRHVIRFPCFFNVYHRFVFFKLTSQPFGGQNRPNWAAVQKFCLRFEWHTHRIWRHFYCSPSFKRNQMRCVYLVLYLCFMDFHWMNGKCRMDKMKLFVTNCHTSVMLTPAEHMFTRFSYTHSYAWKSMSYITSTANY